MDSVEVDTKYAEKVQKKREKEKEEEFQDLSSDDIGKIKRRIANILEPGETVCLSVYCFYVYVKLSPYLIFASL